IREVKLSGSKWNDLPWKFEAGTMAIAGAVGLGAAGDYLRGLGPGQGFAGDRRLAAYTIGGLKGVPGGRVLGPPVDPKETPRRAGVVAFTLADIHPHDVATVLDDEGVCVRAGHHCCMPLHEKLGVPATVRASFHCYSQPEEVDAMIAGLHRARKVFGR